MQLTIIIILLILILFVLVLSYLEHSDRAYRISKAIRRKTKSKRL